MDPAYRKFGMNVPAGKVFMNGPIAVEQCFAITDFVKNAAESPYTRFVIVLCILLKYFRGSVAGSPS